MRVRNLDPIGVSACRKQTVRATLVTSSGKRYSATNYIRRDFGHCPREAAGMATGEGYELCREVCGQPGHAEANLALMLSYAPGDKFQGGTVYLEGHTYACDDCIAAVAPARIVIGAPPCD